jgi:hypothetical protein
VINTKKRRHCLAVHFADNGNKEKRMSKHKSEATDSGRRQFIKTLTVAGGAATVAAVAGEAAAEVQVEDKAEVKGSQGYRETEHVKAYYESARI